MSSLPSALLFTRKLCNKDAVTPKNTTAIKKTLSLHKDPKSSWKLSRLYLHRL